MAFTWLPLVSCIDYKESLNPKSSADPIKSGSRINLNRDVSMCIFGRFFLCDARVGAYGGTWLAGSPGKVLVSERKSFFKEKQAGIKIKLKFPRGRGPGSTKYGVGSGCEVWIIR